MIINSEPISMTEAQKYLDSKSDQGAKTLAFVKKFSSLDAKDSEEMKKQLKGLDLVKINDFQIAKIIEMLPESPEELNRIFTEVSLNEDETSKIIDLVKQFK